MEAPELPASLPPEGSEPLSKDPHLTELEAIEEEFMVELARHIDELPDDEARRKFLEKLYEENAQWLESLHSS